MKWDEKKTIKIKRGAARLRMAPPPHSQHPQDHQNPIHRPCQDKLELQHLGRRLGEERRPSRRVHLEIRGGGCPEWLEWRNIANLCQLHIFFLLEWGGRLYDFGNRFDIVDILLTLFDIFLKSFATTSSQRDLGGHIGEFQWQHGEK